MASTSAISQEEVEILRVRALAVTAAGYHKTFAEDVNKSLTQSESEDKENAAKFTVIDVRQKDAFEKGHINGAINIPYQTVFTPEGMAKLPSDKTQPLAIVCYVGHSSSIITTFLVAMGYNAKNLSLGTFILSIT